MIHVGSQAEGKAVDNPGVVHSREHLHIDCPGLGWRHLGNAVEIFTLLPAAGNPCGFNGMHTKSEHKSATCKSCLYPQKLSTFSGRPRQTGEQPRNASAINNI